MNRLSIQITFLSVGNFTLRSQMQNKYQYYNSNDKTIRSDQQTGKTMGTFSCDGTADIALLHSYLIEEYNITAFLFPLAKKMK